MDCGSGSVSLMAPDVAVSTEPAKRWVGRQSKTKGRFRPLVFDDESAGEGEKLPARADEQSAGAVEPHVTAVASGDGTTANAKAAAIAAARVVAQGSYGPVGSWSASWYYLDSIGQPYGPLESCEMCRLFGGGRFPTGGELLVRLGEWQWYLPLCIVFPDLSRAFADAPVWPQCVSLPEAQQACDFVPWRDTFREEWQDDDAGPQPSQVHDSSMAEHDLDGSGVESLAEGSSAGMNPTATAFHPSAFGRTLLQVSTAVAAGLNPTAPSFHPSAGASQAQAERMHFLRSSQTTSSARSLALLGECGHGEQRATSGSNEAWFVDAAAPGAACYWASRVRRLKH